MKKSLVRGLSVLVLALALSHHVYVMSRGKVSYDGEPRKLREDPDILHRAYFPVSDAEAVGL